jgi:hypothetical protein
MIAAMPIGYILTRFTQLIANRTRDDGDVGGALDFSPFRKLLNVFDEHQSRENAKHVHRAMCENARQGFWNARTGPLATRPESQSGAAPKTRKSSSSTTRRPMSCGRSSPSRRVEKDDRGGGGDPLPLE